MIIFRDAVHLFLKLCFYTGVTVLACFCLFIVGVLILGTLQLIEPEIIITPFNALLVGIVALGTWMLGYNQSNNS